VFCACDIIQLFSVLFYVVRAVQKFDFRFVTKETSKKMVTRICPKNYVM
jgi:hypothetical protein